MPSLLKRIRFSIQTKKRSSRARNRKRKAAKRKQKNDAPVSALDLEPRLDDSNAQAVSTKRSELQVKEDISSSSSPSSSKSNLELASTLATQESFDTANGDGEIRDASSSPSFPCRGKTILFKEGYLPTANEASGIREASSNATIPTVSQHFFDNSNQDSEKIESIESTKTLYAIDTASLESIDSVNDHDVAKNDCTDVSGAQEELFVSSMSTENHSRIINPSVLDTTNGQSTSSKDSFAEVSARDEAEMPSLESIDPVSEDDAINNSGKNNTKTPKDLSISLSQTPKELSVPPSPLEKQTVRLDQCPISDVSVPFFVQRKHPSEIPGYCNSMIERRVKVKSSLRDGKKRNAIGTVLKWKNKSTVELKCDNGDVFGVRVTSIEFIDDSNMLSKSTKDTTDTITGGTRIEGGTSEGLVNFESESQTKGHDQSRGDDIKKSLVTMSNSSLNHLTEVADLSNSMIGKLVKVKDFLKDKRKRGAIGIISAQKNKSTVQVRCNNGDTFGVRLSNILVIDDDLASL